jgi:hypothetical protein
MTWQQFVGLGSALVMYTTLHDLPDAEQTAFEAISNDAAELMLAVMGEEFGRFEGLLRLYGIIG